MENKDSKKQDIIALAVLFCLFTFLLITQWGKWGHPFVDSSREIYIPTLVLQGKVLYKDILNLYGPLSYQLNALLFWIFGVNVNVLYLSGAISTVAIILSAYFISRTITSPFTSFIATLTPMCVLMFRMKCICTSNYFFPYAYAIIYAFAALMLSLLFFIYYLKDKKTKYLYLSSIIIGISIAAKLDYAFFALFIIAALFIDKNINIKEKILNIFLILLPAIICWSALFLQGVGFSDIKGIIDFGISFANAPSVQFFNMKILGQYPSKMVLIMSAKYFLYFCMYALTFLITSILLYFGWTKTTKPQYKIIFLTLLAYPLYLFITNLAQNMHKTLLLYLDFAWASYFILFIFAAHLISEFFINKKSFKELSQKSKLFIFLTTIALFSMHRTFFLVCIGFVGNYSGVLYFMSAIIYFMEFLPEVLIPKYIKTDITTWKNIVALSFIIMSLCYLSTYHSEEDRFSYKLKNIKGSWYTNKDMGYVLDSLADYTKENIETDKTILMLPEGPIISVMTNNPTHPKYYSLIPHMTESFGEENVVKELDNNKPDYIFVNNLPNIPYKANEFGKKYMFELYSFVEDNYKCVKVFPEKGYEYKEDWLKKWNFNIKVYELKSDKISDKKVKL